MTKRRKATTVFKTHTTTKTLNGVRLSEKTEDSNTFLIIVIVLLVKTTFKKLIKDDHLSLGCPNAILQLFLSCS